MAFITQISTSTLSNQNITTALQVHSYTCITRVRKVTVSVALDQIAGNGDYIAYCVRQHGGAGSSYQLVPTTTATVASGVTSVELVTIPIVLEVSDVLTVYVKGLAGDTTTPDIITEVFEELPALAGDAMVLTAAYDAAKTAAQAGNAMTLTSGERDSVADALLDRSNAIEVGLTLRQALRLAASAMAGKLSGVTTATITIRNTADSKNRIVATVDGVGNRTNVTYDVS